ncbi:hypothetical protein [Paenibacillus periandrae]|uniref:hypothetical protein n=1 Tax=Paenibacillus periandrae TaxID=1761741 RepID=UPI001F095719|nr:hypothetical protein [Paenibacillus periandrae]
MDIKIKIATENDNPGELMAYPMALASNRKATTEDVLTICPHCSNPCLYNKEIIELEHLYHGRLVAVCSICALLIRNMTLTPQQRYTILLATERYLDWYRYGKSDMNSLLKPVIGKCFKFVHPETKDHFAMMPVENGPNIDQLYYRRISEDVEAYIIVPLNKANRLLLQFEQVFTMMPIQTSSYFQCLKESFGNVQSLPFLGDYITTLGISYKPSPEPR